MTFTSKAQVRQWIQILALLVLGALAAASAAWGQVTDPAASEQQPLIVQADQELSPQIDSKFPQRTIMEIDIDPRDPVENKPKDRSEELIGKASPSHWFNATYPYQVFQWTAPNIYYQPLYFEDVALERYGQENWGHFDVARSGVLFYGGVLALPWNMLKISPHGTDAPLGFARPGSPAPCVRQYLLYRD